ncbi:MAG: bifunctional glutamate N-acetyltransferase/amino-acid acetyltransferase ArgJ [Deltaproteobacteria bacterium]|nr:bifunctional glutamate N-acetyltransferase/amino-acid acetyltransferase ArgJ [Deltaproteobacteria bacterium]
MLKVSGFKFSGISAGIKGEGKKDLALIVSDKPLSAAAVFTTSKVKAAPVILDQERIKKGIARAVIVNSGNANACTGEQGLEDAKSTAGSVAKSLGISEEDVLLSSTGVIGQRLPVNKIESAVPELVSSLGEGGETFAEAIMTTDSFPKMHSVTDVIAGKEVTVAGVAKGAGMISPDMATMLAYVMTDADIDSGMLSHALKVATDVSFNCITVDGDMSTNDTVIALASGESGIEIVEGEVGHLKFLSMMEEVMVELARMIVKDGEGATKLIEVVVRGADRREDARKAAVKIANSPLVKTAFYGEDANWGRIAGALGGSGIVLDESRLDIYFDNVQIVKGGLFTGEEAEKKATQAMKKDEFSLLIDINLGPHESRIWTCDLTHDYIRINAEYRS